MSKNKYWTAVLYPENMISTWEQDIGDIVQVPYTYCIHDADLTESEERRKKHVHIILAFPNTTTYKHALSVFQKLSIAGFRALNTCEPVINIRHVKIVSADSPIWIIHYLTLFPTFVSVMDKIIIDMSDIDYRFTSI